MYERFCKLIAQTSVCGPLRLYSVISDDRALKVRVFSVNHFRMNQFFLYTLLVDCKLPLSTPQTLCGVEIEGGRWTFCSFISGNRSLQPIDNTLLNSYASSQIISLTDFQLFIFYYKYYVQQFFERKMRCSVLIF